MFGLKGCLLLIFIDSIYPIYIIKSAGVSTKAAMTKNDGLSWYLSEVNISHSKGGYCIDNDICFLVFANGKKYEITRTTNGGDTWKSLTASNMPGEKLDYDISDVPGIYCLNANTCLFGLFDVVIKTEDGFRTNKVVLTIPKGEDSGIARVSSIQCLSNGSICMLSVDQSSGGIIYRSVNGGNSWEKVFTSSYLSIEQISCISGSSGRNLCIAGNEYDKVYGSLDLGENWMLLSYDFYMNYFHPRCPPDEWPCRRSPKIDSVACISPKHCIVAFRGYEDGYGRYISRLNGALCTFIINRLDENLVVKCPKNLSPKTRVKVKCSSSTACIAVTTTELVEHYYPVKSYKYVSEIFRYYPDTQSWLKLTPETYVDVSVMQYIAGNDFIVEDNKSGGKKGGAQAVVGNIVFISIVSAIHLLLFV